LITASIIGNVAGTARALVIVSRTEGVMKLLSGLDHVVILVRDLDTAAASWKRLGFTLAPRGVHSPHMGTANFTMMFDSDYIELIGIVTDTPHNARSRAWLVDHEGVERIALSTHDASALANELRGVSVDAADPLHFGRDVSLADGGSAYAQFRVVRWPPSEANPGLAVFACQHMTPQFVWLPELQTHPNTARRIARVEILAADPRASASDLARQTSGSVEPDANGAFRVPTGDGRATLVVMDRACFTRRRPAVTFDASAKAGAVAVVLEVDDLAKSARCVGSIGLYTDTSVTVPASAATGVVLEFVRANDPGR
jgi:catechol 2,3-dioxygenase-like lactoylglutathione lyase family enzyme